MLGKLIKYEWKGTYKMGGLMLGVVALITLMGWLGFQSLLWGGGSGRAEFAWINVLGIMTLVIYVIMLAAVNYGIGIYVAVHFYKTMYTDEGYLTHTLPVTKHQLLLSKVFVGGMWIFFVLISVYLSVIVLGISMVSAFLPEGYALSSVWRDIEDLLYEFSMSDRADLLGWLLTMLVTSLIQPFTTVSILFGAISIGQLSAKNRVLMAIASYIGITVATNIVSSLMRSAAAITLYAGFTTYINTSVNMSTLVDVAAAVALYIVSWHVASRKLNMA